MNVVDLRRVPPLGGAMQMLVIIAERVDRAE